MPSLTACGRCGSNLAVQTAQLDVNPPRAVKWRKRVRRSFRSVPNFHEQGGKLSEALSQTFLGRINFPDVPRWSIFFRMAIPGWAHWYCGAVIRAVLFFSLYVLCLGGSLLFAGTGLGSLCLGLAVSIHASSILDLILTEEQSASERLGSGMFTLAALAFAIYIPLAMLFVRSIEPMVIGITAPPLARGDIVFVNHLRSPQVGDVVLYQIPDVVFRNPNAARNTNISIRGPRIDRILAGPGQHFSLESGKLLIDGQPPPFISLNPVHFAGDWSGTVGSKQWLILPSTDVYAGVIPVSEVSLVSQQSVRGTVMFRTLPLSRFGSIESIPPVN